LGDSEFRSSWEKNRELQLAPWSKLPTGGHLSNQPGRRLQSS
jgi:hypothetical protein